MTATYAIQFSLDGEKFFTLIKYENKELAESLMKACAGYACEPYRLAKYWRVRVADQESTDFHAVK